MNIIFKQNSKEVQQKYTVLDLDTFKLPDGSIHTACCVVENIPIDELSQTDELKLLHESLINDYNQKQWANCEQSIGKLMGKWGGELDSFYETLQARIDVLKTCDLDDNWSPVLLRE